jgi:hypothetical protein
MPPLTKTQRKDLEEGLAAAYPHLEPQLLGYLLDVYERDSQWLNDRMGAELRKDKISARNAARNNDVDG